MLLEIQNICEIKVIAYDFEIADCIKLSFGRL